MGLALWVLALVWSILVFARLPASASSLRRRSSQARQPEACAAGKTARPRSFWRAPSKASHSFALIVRFVGRGQVDKTNGTKNGNVAPPAAHLVFSAYSTGRGPRAPLKPDLFLGVIGLDSAEPGETTFSGCNAA